MNVFDLLMTQSHQMPRPLSVATLVVLTSVSVGACGPNPTPPIQSAQFEARVSVLNKSHEMHVLRIRDLRPEVQIDCELVAQAPAEHLPADAFGAPVRWALFSGQEIGLGPGAQNMWGGGDDLGGRECNATLIQSDTVDDIVVFWDRSLQPKRFEFDPNIPERIKADPQTVVLRGDYEEVAASEMKPYRLRPCDEGLGCGEAAESVAAEVPAGARYFWESVSERKLHFEQPWEADERPHTPAPACEMPGAEAMLVWETPLNGEWEVLGLREGIDGCHTLELTRHRDEAFDRDYVICAPFAALGGLTLTPATDIIATFEDYSLGEEGGLIISVRYEGEPANAGDRLEIFLTRGQEGLQLNELTGRDLSFETRSQCMPVEVECGQTELPVDVRLPDDRLIGAGESVSFGDGQHEMHLVRALRRPVVDGECAEDEIARRLGGTPGHYVEAVSVIKN